MLQAGIADHDLQLGERPTGGAQLKGEEHANGQRDAGHDSHDG